MTIKAVFVGINKHLDTSIPELSGARRDATALWALFTDTVEDLTGRLLVDEAATHAEVSNAMLGTLAAASADDVVVIAFAGHGSSDGNLVLFDTNAGDLAGTALSMTGLADAFKATKARAVLCILDCCFSGQAPARVLETAARPRNAFALAGVYGEGRILLAACATNQSAWEQPGTGHGLLTHAVIEAMTGTAGASVSFPESAGEIIRLARVEAERISVTQTPVFLGSVQGGLTFPVLKRGDNYTAAFPARPVQQMSGSFAEFSAHGFPPEIVETWATDFPQGLNALQLRAVNEFGVLAGNSLLVVAPTSSGKTMVGEVAAIQAVTSGKKAAFLLPYRALVNEKFEEFTERYAPAGLRVVRCSGDATDGIGPVLAGRYDLGFFTYETFLNLALGSPRLLTQLGLVVLDEGQFITDPQRGITVELIFSLLLRSPPAWHRAAARDPVRCYWQPQQLRSMAQCSAAVVPRAARAVGRRCSRPPGDIPVCRCRRGHEEPSLAAVAPDRAASRQAQFARCDRPAGSATGGTGGEAAGVPQHEGAGPGVREVSRQGIEAAAGHGNPGCAAYPRPDRRIAGLAGMPCRRHSVPQHQLAAGRARSNREGLPQRHGWHPCTRCHNDLGCGHQYAGIDGRAGRERIRR